MHEWLKEWMNEVNGMDEIMNEWLNEWIEQICLIRKEKKNAFCCSVNIR